jgi:caffeoyl-CoA O-methyltransferase
MSDAPKDPRLSVALHEYLVAHGTPPDAVQRDLIEETRQATGGFALMQVAPEQGAFLELLTRISGAKSAIELGTFTGYSALCIARGLPDDGKLLCCDVSREWTAIARRYWKRAGVSHKIDLRLLPALSTLHKLPEEPTLDLAFVDAVKTEYIDYYEALLPRLRPGGLILVDNVLWQLRVVDPTATDEHTEAIRRFNDHVAGDSRIECVLLPISDGLTLIRKKSG